MAPKDGLIRKIILIRPRTSDLEFFLAKPSTPIKGNLHYPHILLRPQEP